MRAVRGRSIGGHYRLVEPIGRGGFAEVWRARDERLHRDVAAKRPFLPAHLTGAQRAERHERTLREARAAARLAHPGVVRVYDVVADRGDLWIIMELIHGRSLAAVVRAEGPLPPRRAAALGLRLLDALRAAHAAGVLHRDVKPANVLIGGGRVVLADFGLAVVEGDPGLTCSGTVMGAAAYTAPERARGEPAVAASDLWSLGATLFYAVEGHRPFEAANANAMLHAIVTREPTPAPHAGPLASVIEGLLRKDPAARLSAGRTAALLVRAAGGTSPWDARSPARTARPRPGTAPADPGTSGPGSSPAAATSPWPACVPVDGPASGERRSLPSGGGVSGHRTVAAIAGHAADRPNATAPRDTAPFTAVGGARTTARRARWAALPVLAAMAATALTTPAVLERVRHAGRPPDRPAGAPAPAPRLLAALSGGPGPVYTLAASPDGRILAAGGAGRTVRLWDTTGRHPAGTLAGAAGDVLAAAFSPHGRMLATGGRDGRVTLWSTRRWRRVATLDTHGAHVDALSFSPDGALLAGAGDAVRLWTLPRGRPARGLPGDGGGLSVAAFAPRGHALATAGPWTLRLWNAPDRPAAVTRLASPVAAIAFSADGRTLATGGYDGRVRLWDVRSRRLVAALPALPGRAGVAFSPDGRWLACAGGDAVMLWNVPGRTPQAVLRTPAATVEAVVFTPAGILATAGDDATVRLWRLDLRG